MLTIRERGSMRRPASLSKNLALIPCLGDRVLRSNSLRLYQPALLQGALKIYPVIVEGPGCLNSGSLEDSPTPEVLASRRPPLPRLFVFLFPRLARV